MSINGASTSKAPVNEPENPHRPERHGLVKVQPARLEDLQPRYASTIKHDQENPEAHGWYAKLSTYSDTDLSWHRIKANL